MNESTHRRRWAILAVLSDQATLDVAARLAEELPCRIAADMSGLAPEPLRRLRGLRGDCTGTTGAAVPPSPALAVSVTASVAGRPGASPARTA